MRQSRLFSIAALLCAVLTCGAAWGSSPPPATSAVAPSAAPAKVQSGNKSTVNHSKLKELQKTFTSGPEVTKACLGCHTEASKQVQHTKHWTWEYTDPKSGQKLGKKNIINNYCTTTISNEKDCMACHAGYGWQDQVSTSRPRRMSIA